jgi:hypothetical protein
VRPILTTPLAGHRVTQAWAASRRCSWGLHGVLVEKLGLVSTWPFGLSKERTCTRTPCRFALRGTGKRLPLAMRQTVPLVHLRLPTLLAFIAVALGCSSSASTPPPSPGFCNPHLAGAECSGDVQSEYVCTGGITPTSSSSSLSCQTLGSAPGYAADATLYCCTETGSTCSRLQSGLQCEAYSSTETPYACIGGAVPSVADESCFPIAPGMPMGPSRYCCTGGYWLNPCFPSNAFSCSSGETSLQCGNASAPISVVFTCNDGQPDSLGSKLWDYCCQSSGSDVCAPNTFAQTGNCPSGGITYTCSGISRPDDADKSLACDNPGFNDQANTSTAYCCLKETGGSGARCSYAPGAPGCYGAGFFSFACTGSSSPEQEYPSLQCSIGVAGTNGQTMYCCVGASFDGGLTDAGSDAAGE